MTGFRPESVNRELDPRGRGHGNDICRRRKYVRTLVAILWAAILGAALCVLLNVWPVESLVEPLNQSSDTATYVRAGLARLSLLLAVLALIAVATGGLCCTVAMSGRESATSWWPVVYAVILGWGALGAVLVARFGLGALVTDMPVVVALVFWGAALSRQTFRGIAGVTWFLTATGVVSAAGGFLLIRSATTPQAAEPSLVQMTAEDRSRLDTIQETLSRAATQGGGVELELVERDLQLVLSRWLLRSHLPVTGDISIPGEPGDAVRLSLTAPVPGWSSRHVAVHVDVRPALNAEVGGLHLQIERLQLGSVATPQVVAWACGNAISDIAGDMPSVRRTIGCLDSVVVAGDRVRVSGSLDTAAVSDVLSGGSVDGDFPESVRECAGYVLMLADSEDPPEGDSRLEAVMTRAFEWARARSAPPDSAVEANLVAVAALAVIIGSNTVSGIISQNGGSLSWAEVEFVKRITVYGRRDLARHLLASAGLTVWTSRTTSETAGLLKEEWDSVGDGSGFSFRDLAADLAGARLARLATRDEATARRVQERFADGVPLSSYMPSVADLPEGISQEKFEQEYGGLIGERFQALEREIDQRLEDLPPLK